MTTPAESIRAMKALADAASDIVRKTASRRRKPHVNGVLVPVEMIEYLHRALRHYPSNAHLDVLLEGLRDKPQ